ncbi:MAG: FISUMP domain-containing protein [Bacteroidales bacterium]|nr:FISUMP domain-containing protein [Bacteroidales bacterium]
MNKAILLFTTIIFFALSNYSQTKVFDIDGNSYNIIQIGNQFWMKENLKVTHYCNNELIPNDTNSTTWPYLGTGARCYYINDSMVNSAIYGALYNWHAVNDSNKICPAGWHVPTDAEWNTMEKYLDNTVDTIAVGSTGTDIGAKLKESDTAHWTSPNAGATNSSNFTALPGGYREEMGVFGGYKDGGYFWTSTSYAIGAAWYRYLFYSVSKIGRSYLGNKRYGFSVRCICDSLAGQINESSSNNRLEIYPNPTNNNMTIEIKKFDFAIFDFKIYNILGNVVAERILSENKNEIDISYLPCGIYFLKLIVDKTVIVRKIIKE